MRYFCFIAAALALLGALFFAHVVHAALAEVSLRIATL